MGAFLPNSPIALVATLVLAAASTPCLALKTGTLAVTADVVPSAIFGVEFSSQSIVITPADFKRGYVDVVMKSRMQLQMTANGPRPAKPLVTVDLAPREDMFTSVNLSSIGAPAGNGHANGNGNGHSNGNGNGNGHSNGNGNGHSNGNGNGHGTAAEGQTSEFRYRFELSPQASVGSYTTSISVGIDL